MTDTQVQVIAAPESAWRRMRLWAVAHAVDDLYQGLVPACVPYFVLDRHYGYVAASGLSLAATLGSALPQLVVGLVVDRRPVSWMAGAGVSLAGIGAGLSGVLPGYALAWLLLFASGLGVAMFHPAAGKAARHAAAGRASAMSIFAAGGNVGFFLAPVLATPFLDTAGLGATALFIPPAVLTGFVLLRHQQRTPPARRPAAGAGPDRWGPFLLLTAVEITRSVNFFGTSTFIELYWITHLHASRPMAGAALTCFLLGGVAGTLLGGRIADRFGLTRTILVGNAAAIPALIALRVCPSAGIALLAALASGVAIRIPFSVLVKLGQDYLPGRPGTAAGVTLGLAVSAGGLAAPVFGAIAAAHGTPAVFTLLCLLPVPAVAMSWLLPEPGPQALRRSPLGTRTARGTLLVMSWNVADIPDQHGRTAVVTGANGGLGLETARQLAAKGAQVVMAVRNQDKAAAAVEDIRASVPDAALELVALDLASQASVREAAEQIGAAHKSIDLLVNNAGVMAIPEAKTVDGFEMQFAVDHLGHWSLTALLLPALLHASGARIVTVTSTAHHMGRAIDPANPHLAGRYGPWRAYGQAKLANFHFGLGLQRELEKAGASAASLIAHPGLSDTDLQTVSAQATGGLSQRLTLSMTRRIGMVPAEGALSQLRAATDPAAKGGEFYGPLYVNSGPPVRKPITRRLGLDKAIATLWEVSERETGVTIDVRAAMTA